MRSARRLQRARLTCHFEGTRSVAIERQRLLVFVLRQLHPDKLTEPENGMNKKSQRRSRGIYAGSILLPAVFRSTTRVHGT